MERASSIGANDGAPRRLAGVVLAAGNSRRMGCPKLLLPWGDDTVLGHTLANAMAGGITLLTVVCGAEAGAVSAQVEAKGLPWLFNASYAQGQSSSLQCGLKTVPEGCGVMFILGDMPCTSPHSYAALAAAYANSRALIVAPVNAAGQRGNPTLWAPELFAELSSLTGDMGARALLDQHRQETLLIPLEEAGLYLDIDTPEDYKRYGE